MATQEEIIKLLMQVQGADEVQRLIAENEKLEDEIRRLSAAMQGQTAAQMAQNPAMRAAAEQLAQNTARVRELQGAMQGIGSGASGAAYKLQVLGQGLDDLTYVGEQGLRPIIGNLMQIHPAVGIAAIAISTIAIPAIKRLWEAFDTTKVKEAGESIDELKEKIKTLEEKTRLSFEDEELDATKEKLEKALEAKRTLDGLLGNQTEQEKKSGQAVRDAVSSDAGREAIEQAKQARMAEASPEDQKRLNAAEAQAERARIAVENATKRRDEAKNPIDRAAADIALKNYAIPTAMAVFEAQAKLQKAIAAKGEAAFAELTRQAISGVGDKQVDAQRELANRLSATNPFGNRHIGLGIANDITDNSPERVADKQRAKEQAERDAKAKGDAEKAAREAKRIQDETNRNNDARRKDSKRVIDGSNKQDDEAGADQWAKYFADNPRAALANPEAVAANPKAAEQARRAIEKEDAEAERKRKATESVIDKTGVEGVAFGMFGQIGGLKGRQRRNANANADATIEQMVAQYIAENPDQFRDVNAVQAQAMAHNAPSLFRRRYAEQLQKQRAAMQAGQGGGRGFNSVGVNGPEEGDEPETGAPADNNAISVIAQNQAGLAKAQGALAQSDAGLLREAIAARRERMIAEQKIASLDSMFRALHQRQRSAQLWGR